MNVQARVDMSTVSRRRDSDDVTESLAKLSVDGHRSLNDGREPKSKKKLFRRGDREQKAGFFKRWLKKPWTIKRVIRWLVLLLIIGLMTFGFRFFTDLSKTFNGNIFNAVTSLVTPDKPLKMDRYGNTNVLLLGTMESDPNHPGALRTNSMVIASINRAKQTISLLSIPRDLWVKGDPSNPCAVGDEYKINATYECELGTNFKEGPLTGLSPIQNDETTAENKTAAIVGATVGVNVNYVVHMNLTVVQQVVDAVGGIDITITSPDPRGILDRNFDWRCNYTCYLVKYPNGPVHLSGSQALWLSQARNDTVAPQYVGYGLPRGNFDREDNQRKIVLATKEKATSIGFLANPVNVVNLLDAAGNNLHTTIDTSEIKSFVDVIKGVPSSKISSIDIQSVAPNILTTGWSPDGTQSIVMPTAGLYDYSEYRVFMSQVLQGKAAQIAEAAAVDVLNGSGVSGAAAQEATQLQSDGFIAGTVASAPSSYSSKVKYELYDLSKGKDPATLAALKKELNVSKTSTTLPSGITSTSPFVVILGASSSASANQ
jgi:anionic cell wall polymer biosynthesis LytR-Cps2A-Psr (LCP) family protein